MGCSRPTSREMKLVPPPLGTKWPHDFLSRSQKLFLRAEQKRKQEMEKEEAYQREIAARQRMKMSEDLAGAGKSGAFHG